MESVFEKNTQVWKFVVGIGFILCVIFLIYEIFLTNGNIMAWMIKTIDSGVVQYDELAQKSYLLIVIPAIGVLEFIRKKVSS